MAKSPIPKRDFATFTGNMRRLPPIMQHALQYEVLEDSPQALEYRVTKCLWAKSFLEGAPATSATPWSAIPISRWRPASTRS